MNLPFFGAFAKDGLQFLSFWAELYDAKLLKQYLIRTL